MQLKRTRRLPAFSSLTRRRSAPSPTTYAGVDIGGAPIDIPPEALISASSARNLSPPHRSLSRGHAHAAAGTRFERDSDRDDRDEPAPPPSKREASRSTELATLGKERRGKSGKSKKSKSGKGKKHGGRRYGGADESAELSARLDLDAPGNGSLMMNPSFEIDASGSLVAAAPRTPAKEKDGGGGGGGGGAGQSEGGKPRRRSANGASAAEAPSLLDNSAFEPTSDAEGASLLDAEAPAAPAAPDPFQPPTPSAARAEVAAPQRSASPPVDLSAPEAAAPPPPPHSRSTPAEGSPVSETLPAPPTEALQLAAAAAHSAPQHDAQQPPESEAAPPRQPSPTRAGQPVAEGDAGVESPTVQVSAHAAGGGAAAGDVDNGAGNEDAGEGDKAPEKRRWSRAHR